MSAIEYSVATERRRPARGAADALLTKVGLSDLADRLPSQVSGGQAQRAAVCRAVVHGPELVLADEPTGALDSANAEGVLDLLLHLAKDLGAGVVIATHDQEVARRCDRVLRLRDGCSVAELAETERRGLDVAVPGQGTT